MPIAADTGGLREVVPLEGAGLRFRASDPEHLAEAAVQVLSDEQLSQKMIAEGLAHIRLFDWEDVAGAPWISTTKYCRYLISIRVFVGAWHAEPFRQLS